MQLYQIIYSVSTHLLKLSERATPLLLTDGTKMIGSCKCLGLISHEWSPHFGGLKQRQTESVRWVKRERWEGEKKQSAARRLAGEKWSSPTADGCKTSWVVTLSARAVAAFQTQKHLFTRVCFTVGFYHSSSQLYQSKAHFLLPHKKLETWITNEDFKHQWKYWKLCRVGSWKEIMSLYSFCGNIYHDTRGLNWIILSNINNGKINRFPTLVCWAAQ